MSRKHFCLRKLTTNINVDIMKENCKYKCECVLFTTVFKIKLVYLTSLFLNAEKFFNV